ncbi:MAG: PqqD family protein [Prevotella sp.]|nr:PqqD family protein [Prevotella sp.]
MRARKGFNLREVCGEQIIVAEGKENIDFTSIVSMNESSAFLWRSIQDKEFTVDDLADLLIGEYMIDENTPLDRETALADAEAVLEKWIEADIVEK